MNPTELAAEASKGKYSFLCADTVAVIAAEEYEKYKKDKDRIKAIKKRLHILSGAFEDEGLLSSARKWIDEGNTCDREQILKLLELHASTRERLPFIDSFLKTVDDMAEHPGIVCDIGCGFLPIAETLLRTDEKRIAFDIDGRIIDTVNRFYLSRGLEPCGTVADATVRLSEVHADAVYLFKLLPLIEQRRKGLSFELMKSLDAPIVIVSFPTKSLAGREKGMEAFYSNFFENGLPG